MISFDTAERLATEALMSLQNFQDDDLVFATQETVEIDKGWLFFYNTREYIENGNILSALAGNGPIFVSRTGEVRHLPTAVSWEESLQHAQTSLQSNTPTR